MIVDYTVSDIQLGPSDEINGTGKISLDLNSEIINKYYSKIDTPLSLVDSFDLRHNESYIQALPVISLDFETQFETLYSEMNIAGLNDESINFIEIEYEMVENTFFLFVTSNNTGAWDNRVFQEFVISYNVESGVLEKFRSITTYYDPTMEMEYIDEVDIYNTSENFGLRNGPNSKVTSSSSSSYSQDIYPFIFLFVVIFIVVGYLGLKRVKPVKSKLEIISSAIDMNKQTMRASFQSANSSPNERKYSNERTNIVKSLLCPSCSTINPINSIYCFECGTFIT